MKEDAVPHALDCCAGRYHFAEAKLTEKERIRGITAIARVKPLDRAERRAERLARKKRERRIYRELLARYAAVAEDQDIFNPGRE